MQNRKLTKISISKKALREIRGKTSLVDYDGAGDGIRTHDFLLGKQTFYH